MKADAPAWLRAQVRWHNLHAIWLSILSLAVAAFAWVLAYFFFFLVLLGAATVFRGSGEPQMPLWIPIAGLLAVAALWVWGVIDYFRYRYSGPSDREIVGWHLVGEFLLLPVRLTLAIWGNLTAIRWLREDELARAWELLRLIQSRGKGYLSAFALVEPDSKRLEYLVSTLQILDLIDLHRGEDDWYYTVRSTHWEELRNLLRPADKNG